MYIIKSGDTLSGIASANKTTVADLMKLNPTIKDPNKIYAGSSLNLSAPQQNPVSPVAPPTSPTPTTTTPTLDSNTLKTGMSQPDITGMLPDNTASDKALKVYSTNTLTDATQTSTGIQKQIDEIKSAQLKDAQFRANQANNATADYNSKVNPVIDNFNQDLTNQRTAINSVYTPEYYTSLLNDKKSITDEIVGYSKLLDGAINDVSMPSLASVATGRKNAVIADYQAKINIKQAALSAIDGNFTLASSILDNGVAKLDEYYTKQLNFQKLAQDIFKTSDVKDLTDKTIADLEAKKKTLDSTKTAVQNLLSDPSTALIVQKAGILLTDTADQVAQKLSGFYVKNPGYNPENMKANQSLITKYPDAGINIYDTAEMVKSKLEKSALYQKETASGKFTLTYDPITGKPVVFNSNTGNIGNGSEMRTDRNNNPTAMTTDVAKTLGLVEGVDYTKGDAFPDNPNLFTAKLLGDPIQTTIKALDIAANNANLKAFYTQSGQQRWTHTAMSDEKWLSLTPDQKRSVIASMYQKEGGSGILLDTNTEVSQSAKNWATLINTNKAKLNEVPEKERKAVVQALAEEGTVSKADAETTAKLQDKISQIDDLIKKTNNSGAVGPNFLARTSLTSWMTGSRQAFVGSIKQLISKETLDTLINLKKSGGTLGALSDQERIMLQNAATKIGGWEMKDKNGNGTGFYNVREKDFKVELENIKKLTQRALDNAGGQTGVVNTLEQKLSSNPTKVDEYNLLVKTYPGLSDDDYNQLLGD